LSGSLNLPLPIDDIYFNRQPRFTLTSGNDDLGQTPLPHYGVKNGNGNNHSGDDDGRQIKKTGNYML
jgi:hypothetical protein